MKLRDAERLIRECGSYVMVQMSAKDGRPEAMLMPQGKPLTVNQANKLKVRVGLQPAGDSLFPGEILSQTWKAA